jgi:hypothetical protein
MAHLDETDFILLLAQRFHDAIDTVARQTEYAIDPPIEQ